MIGEFCKFYANHLEHFRYDYISITEDTLGMNTFQTLKTDMLTELKKTAGGKMARATLAATFLMIEAALEMYKLSWNSF